MSSLIKMAKRDLIRLNSIIFHGLEELSGDVGLVAEPTSL